MMYAGIALAVVSGVLYVIQWGYWSASFFVSSDRAADLPLSDLSLKDGCRMAYLNAGDLHRGWHTELIRYHCRAPAVPEQRVIGRRRSARSPCRDLPLAGFLIDPAAG